MSIRSRGGTSTDCAFVTGATGFVGLNVVDELLSRGWEVHALHRKGSSRAAMLRNLPHASKLLHLVEGELTMSREFFTALVPSNTNVLYHLCHLKESSINKSRKMPAPGFTQEGGVEHLRINELAMSNVIFAAAAKKIRRVVFCSSWSAYGIQKAGTMVTEDTPSTAADPVPQSWCGCQRSSPVPYFATKLQLEKMLIDAVNLDTIQEAVILQPCSIFGRYGAAGWCILFLKLLETKGKVPGFPGSSSFTDVEQLAIAFANAANSGPGEGERYIIGGTNERNLTMIQEECNMAKLIGTPFPKKAVSPSILMFLAKWNETMLRLPGPLKNLRIKPSSISTPWLTAKLVQDQGTLSAKAQKILGYKPVSLRATLMKNYQWLVSHGLLPARPLQ